MNFRTAKYMIDEMMINLGRRKGANAIAVIIMGLSLLILVVFFMVTLNMASLINKTSEEMRLFVYLQDDLDQEVTQKIQLKLLGLRGIEEVSFISKAEALIEFREMLGEESDLLDDLVENPLPDAFRVKPKQGYITSEFLASIAGETEKWNGVEEVRYGKKWFERGERLAKGIYIIDLAFGLIIFLSVIFVIYNTVRLTVLHRRTTIDVMKLVGATNAFIRIPFILEGALQGVAAALIAIALLMAIYSFSARYLPGLVFMRHSALVGFVIFCAILGAVGSYSAMRRFLKL
ncbi:MAG: ABC transporter permease [Candidatus Krumholzibacteria bacterium]|nr:ABC transporter permease [Candidatus Krumholzibacteria bacterium]